jgi:hypothetical protein
VIREAAPEDVPVLAELAARRRTEYASVQPQFWRQASDALEQHRLFLATQVEDADVIALVAAVSTDSASSTTGPERSGRIDGFVIATVTAAPPVYDPGGPTGVIDDFTVSDPHLWSTVGRDLLAAAMHRLSVRGTSQVVVVCGDHDEPKLAALRAAGLTTASQWLVAPLTRDDSSPSIVATASWA